MARWRPAIIVMATVSVAIVVMTVTITAIVAIAMTTIASAIVMPARIISATIVMAAPPLIGAGDWRCNQADRGCRRDQACKVLQQAS